MRETLDLAAALRVNQLQKRVNVDFPSCLVRALNKEAQRLGVTRQFIIKAWISERLRKGLA